MLIDFELQRKRANTRQRSLENLQLLLFFDFQLQIEDAGNNVEMHGLSPKSNCSSAYLLADLRDCIV